MPIHLTTEQLSGFAPRMPLVSHDDSIYLAGLTDGEGHISYRLHPGRPFAYALLGISNTYWPLMPWLDALGGGRVSARTRPPYKTIYDWTVTRQDDVAYLLRVMIPYLRIKHDVAVDTLTALSQTRQWDRSKWNPPHRRGSEAHAAQLTPEQVRTIRESDVVAASLARLYGVRRRPVARIPNMEAWIHSETQHPDTAH